MPSRTTLTLLHKEAKKRVFLQGTVVACLQENAYKNVLAQMQLGGIQKGYPIFG